MRVKILVVLAILAISTSGHTQDSLPIQGKGMYIWQLWSANNGNLTAVTSRLKSEGVTWIVIKMGDGDSYYNSPGHSLYNWATASYKNMDSVVATFHLNGIKILAFQYVYGVPHHWGNSLSETDVANMIMSVKDIDGLIIDAEIEYDTLANRVSAAQAYCDSIRARHPNSFVGLTSWARINGHNTFPWTTFLDRVQVNMPQTYWAARPTTPQNELGLMSGQFASSTKTWVGLGDTAASKPIMPIGQGEYFGYSNNVKPGDIASFCNLSQQAYHYAGVSLWEYGQIDSPFVWDEYASAWQLTAVSPSLNTPIDYNLSQNYPNPFNPTTTIGYRLSTSAFVNLKVYDILGREIRTIVDGRRSPGEHTVVFDAGNLPSGVYYYRLSFGAYSSTRKMMVVK
jgi:Secretion system C-terminal sorting domain